jgi:hypothetical protein
MTQPMESRYGAVWSFGDARRIEDFTKGGSHDVVMESSATSVRNKNMRIDTRASPSECEICIEGFRRRCMKRYQATLTTMLRAA